MQACSPVIMSDAAAAAAHCHCCCRTSDPIVTCASLLFSCSPQFGEQPPPLLPPPASTDSCLASPAVTCERIRSRKRVRAAACMLLVHSLSLPGTARAHTRRGKGGSSETGSHVSYVERWGQGSEKRRQAASGLAERLVRLITQAANEGVSCHQRSTRSLLYFPIHPRPLLLT